MKRTKWIISAICLLLAVAGIIAVLHTSAVRKIRGGSTLPYQLVNGFGRVVATVIPSVMYGGRIYIWENMSADSQSELQQGHLQEGYIYVGDIQYMGTDQLTEDFQFTAVFEASGQLYSNPNAPDHICVRITTSWLNDSYVMFAAKD